MRDYFFSDSYSHRIVDKYMTLYSKTKEALSETYRKHTTKTVLEVIKTTTKTNIRELNKRLMELLNVDEEFKKTIC